MNPKHKTSRAVAIIAVCLLVTLACGLTGDTDTPEPPVSEPKTEPEAPPEVVVPNTPRPTSPPPPTAVPAEPSCYKWDQITMDMAGEEVCVYGTAFSHAGQSRIDFSPEKNSFFLIDATYYYPELGEGVCVAAEEKVEIFDNKIPFMTLRNGLYNCEPWMEE